MLHLSLNVQANSTSSDSTYQFSWLSPRLQRQPLGAIQVLRNAMFLEIGPPPTPRNANSAESYTFVTLFSEKFYTPHPICVT